MVDPIGVNPQPGEEATTLRTESNRRHDIAHYIIVTETDDTTAVTHIEAKNRTDAARQFFDADESDTKQATLYRVAAAPVKVSWKVETTTKIVVA